MEYNCYSFLPFSIIESKTRFIRTLLLLIWIVSFACLSLTYFRPIGILLVEIDIDSFEDTIITSNFNSDSSFLLTTENNTLIWGYQEENLGYHIGDVIPAEILGASPYSIINNNGNSYYCFNTRINSMEYNCYSFLPLSSIVIKNRVIL
jgi:two-component system, sensor histidine kinase YesM